MNHPVQIANEAVFLEALGIEPSSVQKGTVRIEFSQEGAPVIMFGVMRAVPPKLLGMAFIASSATDEADGTPDEEDTGEKEAEVRPIRKKTQSRSRSREDT